MNLAVFDLDGTLTTTFEVDGHCYVRAFADALNIHSVDSRWESYEHVTDLGVMNQLFHSKLGRPPQAQEISRFVERFVELIREAYDHSTTEFKEVAGANLLLETMSASSGWRAAIATGAWERSARFKVEASALQTNGLPMAFAEDGPSREAIIRKAIERALISHGHTRFERIVLIGDGIWDLRAASRLQLPFIGVSPPERSVQLRRSGATHVVENFLDIAACLEYLEEATVPSV